MALTVSLNRLSGIKRVKGMFGVVLLPLPFIPDSPLCPVTAVKRVIPGVVLLPLPFIPDSPLCPVTAVKRVIPGMVLLPLPFISDSRQFALLLQLKGLCTMLSPFFALQI